MMTLFVAVTQPNQTYTWNCTAAMSARRPNNPAALCAAAGECRRFADPGYYEGDPEDEGAPDPLAAALPNKEAYQNIRALPAEPGSALLFTHRSEACCGC